MRFNFSFDEIDTLLKCANSELFFLSEAQKKLEESGRSLEGNKKSDDYKFILSKIKEWTTIKNKLEAYK